MAVARITEISAISEKSFEDAINIGIERATRTLRGVTDATIQDQNVMVENNKIVGYRVNLRVSFILEG